MNNIIVGAASDTIMAGNLNDTITAGKGDTLFAGAGIGRVDVDSESRLRYGPDSPRCNICNAYCAANKFRTPL
ncbi:hypothetical protein [Paraburkholderia heleia]|uniref:hypothetical protein n=1 Tax=Paraburkholderia heleia TaxID=634127 RepID=UPI002AB6D9DA|nr:hypothetical protein [Paraburkholderia heleia]